MTFKYNIADSGTERFPIQSCDEHSPASLVAGITTAKATIGECVLVFACNVYVHEHSQLYDYVYYVALNFAKETLQSIAFDIVVKYYY